MTTLLIKGYSVLLDDEDVEKVNYLIWHVKKEGEWVYFRRHPRIPGMRKENKHFNISLHREIMKCNDSKMCVDHINGNTLDNRKENLRICTSKENNRNRKRSKKNKSGFKGVFWHSQNQKWFSHICVDRKIIYLGTSFDPKELHEIYCRASEKYHGEFGRFE